MKISLKFKRSATIFIALTSLIFTVVGTQSVLAQECVQCDSTTSTGLFSSAIGKNTIATGDFSFVAGENSKANGRSSFSLGQRTNVYDNYALGIGRFLEVYGSSSVAIGRFLKTLSPDAMVIGFGFSTTETLNNDVHRSLMIGFESTKPTLFIGPSNGVNSTGKIGIGNVTDPQAKLHILSDENEAATLKLEHQTTGIKRYAEIDLGTHHIRAGNTENMVFSTPDTNRHFVFENGNVGIGLAEPEAKLHVQGNFKLGSDIGDVGENSFAGGEGSSASGKYSFAFGRYAKATHLNSVAIGFKAEATSEMAVAIGYINKATAESTYLFGERLMAGSSGAFVIGRGASSENSLQNNVNSSLMIGFNSTVPTFFVSQSSGAGTTGKIGIGNITNPQAKLHIKADDNEDASLKLETSGEEQYSRLQFSENHEIKTRPEDNFHFSTQAETDFVFHQGNIFIEDIQKGVIMRSPDGQCWLGKVNNQGMLAFEQTTCPEEQTSQSETMAPASQLKVYPNPATGYVEVHTGTISGKLALSLMDANGKQLREQQAQSGKNILNLDGLPSGAYILVLKQDGKLLESTKLMVN